MLLARAAAHAVGPRAAAYGIERVETLVNAPASSYRRTRMSGKEKEAGTVFR